MKEFITGYRVKAQYGKYIKCCNVVQLYCSFFDRWYEVTEDLIKTEACEGLDDKYELFSRIESRKNTKKHRRHHRYFDRYFDELKRDENQSMTFN